MFSAIKKIKIIIVNKIFKYFIFPRIYFFDSIVRLTKTPFLKERLDRMEFFYNSFSYLSFNEIKGDYCEFGCHGGATFSYAYHEAKRFCYEAKFFAFDSFQGLPKFWRTGFDVGKFSTSNGKAPIFEEKNIKIIDGLFEETCDIFFKLQREQKNTIALLHIDCDIYSSTKTIFNAIEKYMNMDIDNNNRINLLRNGTIIVFDELLCYNGFEKHELLAFYEFLQNNPKISYEIIGTKHIGCMSVAIKLII